MAAQLLESNGIPTEILGAKEYTSILLGSEMGSFDLLVADEKWSEANEILKHELSLAKKPEIELSRPQLHFKKAVIYSLFAMLMLPIVFNFYSLKHLQYYLQVEKNKTKRIRASILIIALQIPSVIFSWIILQHLFGE